MNYIFIKVYSIMYLVRKSIAPLLKHGDKYFLFFGFSQDVSGIFSYLAKAFKPFHFYSRPKGSGQLITPV
jgi:hypothetical protein